RCCPRGRRGHDLLPRSNVGVDGRGLALRCGQGAPTPERGAPRSSVRQGTSRRKRTKMSDLSGRTTVVVGASRGVGGGGARACAEAGARVVGVARTGRARAELGATNAKIGTEVADAADAAGAWSLLDQYEPEVLILVAGATPVMRPLQHQTWET